MGQTRILKAALVRRQNKHIVDKHAELIKFKITQQKPSSVESNTSVTQFRASNELSVSLTAYRNGPLCK